MTGSGHADSHTPTNSEVVVTRHPNLWFEDGNVVIAAGGTRFCVHKSLLSRLSPIFRDVFAIPQPAAGSETVLGLPIVHVSDEPWDMGCMLSAIYVVNYLADLDPYIPFETLSALMRLGHKYEITTLVNSATHYLGLHYTTDFKSWIDYWAGDRLVAFCWKNEWTDAIETINIARLTGKTALIPAAFYEACQLGFHLLLKAGDPDEGGAPGDVELFSREDIARCVCASERLITESANIAGILAKVSPSAPGCESKETCTRHIRALVQAVADAMPKILTTNVFAPLRERINDGAPRTACWKKLCDACRDALTIQYQLAQREMWGRLPKILGLSCEELGISWAGPSAESRTEVF